MSEELRMGAAGLPEHGGARPMMLRWADRVQEMEQELEGGSHEGDKGLRREYAHVLEVAGIWKDQAVRAQDRVDELQLAVAQQLAPLDVASAHIAILRRKSEDYTPKERDNVAIIVETHVNEARAALFAAITEPTILKRES